MHRLCRRYALAGNPCLARNARQRLIEEPSTALAAIHDDAQALGAHCHFEVIACESAEGARHVAEVLLGHDRVHR